MNLLFDLDGTLTDPFLGITRCIAHALEAAGRQAPSPEELGWCIGPPLQESFRTLLDTTDETVIDSAIESYRERFRTVGMFENGMYAGIPEALSELGNAGHRLFVATSKPAVFATRIVEHFGLGSHFATVYGSELDGTRSAKADLIAHILNEESLSVDETMMIGDRHHDIVGAKANGMRALGVLWGYGSQQELEEAGADTCVADPAELPEAIRELG
jgi:phosphoglycolate phosphatase